MIHGDNLKKTTPLKTFNIMKYHKLRQTCDTFTVYAIYRGLIFWIYVVSVTPRFSGDALAPSSVTDG